MRMLDKGLSVLEKGLTWFCAGVLFVMMGLISCDVILRYFFNRPITGVDEIVRELMMPAIVFLTMSYVLRQQGHVKITFFLHYFSGAVRKGIDAVNYVLGILLFSFIAHGSFKRTMAALANNEFSSSLLAYPMAPAYFLVVIGGVMMVVRFFLLLLRIFQKDMQQEI